MSIKASCILLLLTSALAFASSAAAVTHNSLTAKTTTANFVAPKLAERAVADVQIRRIKHLISTQKIDPDVAFDRWEKLQNQFRDR